MSEPLTATAQEQDAELAQVNFLQQAFKHRNLVRVAAALVRAAMQSSGYVWPDDEVMVETVAKLAEGDKNVVGTAYRWLGKVKILERTQDRHRSQSKASKGREVTKWKICDWKLARTFLRRNDEQQPDQKELFQ